MESFLKLTLKLKLIIFIYCLSLCPLFAAKTIFVDSSRPPPGFALTQMSQHLRVSVLSMNKMIGFFYIELTDGQLKFNSPEQLLLQLTEIKDKKIVLEQLKQSFPLNIDCINEGFAALPSRCEELPNKPIYLIYNPQKETVSLFITSAYFKKPKLDDELLYIPDSTEGWSYINKFGAAGSFSNAISWSQLYSSLPNYYNLYSNNVLSYGNNSLVGNLSQNNGLNDGQHFQIQNLYFQNIKQNKVYLGGYLINPVSPFFQTQVIAGVAIKSTLETVKNTDSITATPLVIFVPQASQVSIFKNEQLIFSQFLSAGYHNINTGGFPEGGYELTVKIGEGNIVRRFFSKGLFLPPMQAPQFYIMGGYLTNGLVLNDNNYDFLPKSLGIPVFQAGVNKRISERFALQTDVLLNSEQGLLDFGSTFFIGNSYIKTAALIGTKNNYGIYSMLSTQLNRLNFNIIATKIFYQNKQQNYYFLNNLIDNDSASLSYQLSPNDLLGVQANYNKVLCQAVSYNAGTYYQHSLGNYRGLGFFVNAAYNKAFYVGQTYYVSLSMNFSEGKLAGTEALLLQNQNKDAYKNKNRYQNQLALPTVLQGNTTYSNQNDMGTGYSVNENHTLSPTVTSIAGIYDYTAPSGFASTYTTYNRIRGEKNSLGYGGNLETELALNQHGVAINGVDRSNTAGILLKVITNSTLDKTVQFALLDENNRRIAVIPANKKIFVSLPGYTDQNYTLVNLSNADFHITDATRHITLYPGNIADYSWEAEKRLIVIGRVIIANKNQPGANAWIYTGKNGIFSDREGYFQLELSPSTTQLQVDSPYSCQIHLPKLTINKNYLYLGDVLCV